MTETIETERLRLVPFDLPLLLAARAEDRDRVSELLGAEIAPGWPSDGVVDFQLPGQIVALEKHGVELKWLGRLIVLKEGPVLIGVINLKGPPDNLGRVEIGYEIEQGYRRKGYASEAARALIEWSLRQPDVKAVRARTMPQNEISQAMLRKLGFEHIGESIDANLGTVMLWEFTSSPSG